MLQGESDRARKELEEDLGLARSVPSCEPVFPELALSEALTLAALGRWSGELSLFRSPIHTHTTNLKIGEVELGLAELSAVRIGWLPSIVTPPWRIPADLPTEAWTDRVLSSLQSDAAKVHLDSDRIPVILWIMRHDSASTLARQRRIGELRDAHRTADQLLALAERLTQSYPDQAIAYMLLSEAYVQKAKNTYREDDAPALERWERKALDAAIHAATLEPENEEAHGLVRDRRARLRKLASH